MPLPDLAAVATFVRERFSETTAPVALARGEWSRAYAFTAEGRDLVARFGQHREDYEKDRVAMTFASPALPVPTMLEIGEGPGGVYSIAERAFGAFLDECDATAFRRVLPALFAALDALRGVAPRGAGYGPWRPDGTAPHASWRAYLLDVTNDHPGARTAGWRTLLASRPRAEAAFAEGYAALEHLVAACPDARHVVHTDLMAGNVLVDGERVTAVLDWGNAIYGDFLYDLAHVAFWLPWFPALAGIDVIAEAAAHYAATGVVIPALAERIRCYMVHIGLDAQAYNALTYRWDELARSAARTLQVARNG